MILPRSAILANVKQGLIGIRPFDEHLLKDSSYTFTLGDEYFEFSPSTGTIVDPADQHEPQRRRMAADGLILERGGFVLCQTREFLELGPNMSCLLSTRGSCAKLGLNVLQSSQYAEPNTRQHIILEISNNGPYAIRLNPGLPVAKGIFVPVDASQLLVAEVAE